MDIIGQKKNSFGMSTYGNLAMDAEKIDAYNSMNVRSAYFYG